MRELVEQIDAHAEPNDMEVTSIPSTQNQLGVDLHFPVANQQQTRPNPQHDLLAEPYFYSFYLFYCNFIISFYLFGNFAYVTGMW